MPYPPHAGGQSYYPYPPQVMPQANVRTLTYSGLSAAVLSSASRPLSWTTLHSDAVVCVWPFARCNLMCRQTEHIILTPQAIRCRLSMRAGRRIPPSLSTRHHAVTLTCIRRPLPNILRTKRRVATIPKRRRPTCRLRLRSSRRHRRDAARGNQCHNDLARFPESQWLKRRDRSRSTRQSLIASTTKPGFEISRCIK